MNPGFVYILSNKNRTSLYIGVTNNIWRRILEHKSGKGSTFTKRYNCIFLMYFKEFQNIEHAIVREKELKNWHRPWKLELIMERNSEMIDLAADWYTEEDIKEFKETQDYI